MQGAQSRLLDATRMHLHHGPIDLIVEAFGPDRQMALTQAKDRFQTVLDELVSELDLLRQPLGDALPNGAVARHMAAAVAPFKDVFVTPMAAVAGAVADEVLAAMCQGCRLEKAYVNNGGDIAIYLAEGQSLTASVQAHGDRGRVRLNHDQTARGLATSGWRGRSHSRGIADAVSVVARTAAAADVAATLIANAVDLPGHPAIKRDPACDLSPDSDLGARLATVAVGTLKPEEISLALNAGRHVAEDMLHLGLMAGAALFLGDDVKTVGVYPQRAKDPLTGEIDGRFQIA